MAFLGSRDLLVLEKNTGQVRRVLDGNLVSEPVLDLAVNNASERGLLGIAVHPDFPRNRGVYLFWSCRTAGPASDPFVPGQRKCNEREMFGEDTDDILAAPLLGNRIDRFVWTGLVCGSIVTCSRCARSRTTPRPTRPIRETRSSRRAPTMTAA